MNKIIMLTAEEALMASSVATMQMLRKITKGRNTDHGFNAQRGMRLRWADTIHGMMGEIALARALKLPWTPGGMEISKGDVDNKIEVRATEYKDGHLLVYADEADSSLFVLMIGHWPQFEIAGGMYGSEAKQQEYWREDSDPPCFWIPRKKVHDIEGLMESDRALV